jgi:hypothetical protein
LPSLCIMVDALMFYCSLMVSSPLRLSCHLKCGVIFSIDCFQMGWHCKQNPAFIPVDSLCVLVFRGSTRQWSAVSSIFFSSDQKTRTSISRATGSKHLILPVTPLISRCSYSSIWIWMPLGTSNCALCAILDSWHVSVWTLARWLLHITLCVILNS